MPTIPIRPRRADQIDENRDTTQLDQGEPTMYAPIEVPRYVFHCPYCQSTAGIYRSNQVSGAGWIVFVVLLLFCFPLCFIGLLINDTSNYCQNCRVKIA